MTRKSLGYVRLEWTCPNCDTRNPGPQKVCASCGMPQPENVEFEQPAQEKIITDEAEIERAKAGPDIQCHYCGTRNPANAETCSQCGAPLGEGTARASGQILGAHRDKPAEPITCPACGTPNEPDAARCVQCGSSLTLPKSEPSPPPKPQTAPTSKRHFGLVGGAVGILLLVAAACITLFILYNRTEELTGRVRSVTWTREIAIEQLAAVTGEDWRDEIPPGAVIGTCTEKIHHTETRATGRFQEICGTPYTVDTGSGYGEVAQDCTNEEITEEVPVYEDSCEYTVDEWQTVDTASLSGADFDPDWPDLQLRSGQREGDRNESYKITFETEAGPYIYTTGNEKLFAQAEPGTRWILKVNTFNTVTDIEPLR